jgi:hypothetical protein
MRIKQSCVILLALSSLLQAGDTGSRVLYVGGTVPELTNKSSARIGFAAEESLNFSSRNNSFAIPYKDIDTLEYGTRVGRRYIEAALISPVFLLGKKKTHYLTIGYVDDKGQHQAMVLEVGKNDIRPMLVSLEARTGRRVEFQDEEARKEGKG